MQRSILSKILTITLAAQFLLPTTSVFAQAKIFPIDLLPPSGSTMPKFPSPPSIGNPGSNNSGSGKPNNNNGGNGVRPGSSTNNSPNIINAAEVPAEFTCQIFDYDSSNGEIFEAIDALSKEVKASPACNGEPSGNSLKENGDKIKESLASLTTIIGAQAGADVNPAQIEQNITSAIGALGNIGDLINNNEFLNSECGRQTMSSGRLLLAINDVISGLSPYALLAVSMNAAMAPALPFVIGATVVTTGISAITKMFQKDLIDMNNPEHRKAIVQNTCQFIKVTKKVQFLQLAQAGKIEQINKELLQSIDLYSNISQNFSSSMTMALSQRDAYLNAVAKVEAQYGRDREELIAIQDQVKENDDDFLKCVLSSEMTKWGADGISFPSSVFSNLKIIASQANRATQAQAVALKALHDSSSKKINEYALDAGTNDRYLQMCAATADSWFKAINQALKITYDTTQSLRAKVEDEMSKDKDYVILKTQEDKINRDRTLVNRVEKAMEELSKDNSIIDRSEMAQRLVSLKSGLFQGQSDLPFWGASLVQQWINHTKTVHDVTMSAVEKDLQALRAASYSVTDAGRILSASQKGTPYVKIDPKVGLDSFNASKKLTSLTLRNLPLGSREHELVCQSLHTTWLDYTAAIDHLGSIQFFCDMIDSVLDSKVDKSIINSCRGNVQINGQVYEKSLVEKAQDVLAVKGYQADMKIIVQRTNDLQCPLPSVAVMGQ